MNHKRLKSYPKCSRHHRPLLTPFSSLSPQITLLPFAPFDRVTKPLKGRYSRKVSEGEFIGKVRLFILEGLNIL